MYNLFLDALAALRLRFHPAAHYRYNPAVIIGALLVVIETAFELFIPLLMADLIDVGVKNHIGSE